MDINDPNPRGMASIARGIIKSFDDADILLKVGNCELLINRDKTHMALVNPTNLSFVGFYRVGHTTDNLQAAQDFLTHGKISYEQLYGTAWTPKKR